MVKIFIVREYRFFDTFFFFFYLQSTDISTPRIRVYFFELDRASCLKRELRFSYSDDCAVVKNERTSKKRAGSRRKKRGKKTRNLFDPFTKTVRCFEYYDENWGKKKRSGYVSDGSFHKNAKIFATLEKYYASAVPEELWYFFYSLYVLYGCSIPRLIFVQNTTNINRTRCRTVSIFSTLLFISRTSSSFVSGS